MKKQMRIIRNVLKYYVNLIRYPITIHDTMETLDEIARGKSVSRFGDGEFFLVEGVDECYQKGSMQIQQALADTLADVKHNDRCLICIPFTLNSLSAVTKRSKAFWIDYQTKHRGMIYQYLNHSIDYYDAQVTRAYINKQSKEYSAKIFETWKKIWDGKNVLIVEGSKTRFGVGNDLLSNAGSLRRIICPAENAFEKIEEIRTAIISMKEFDIVLLALGPTASVLAYDLSLEGLWAIDIGNLDVEYEWSLQKAEVMTAVHGKYTCEAIDGTNGQDVAEEVDQEYLEQIICTI